MIMRRWYNQEWPIVTLLYDICPSRWWYKCSFGLIPPYFPHVINFPPSKRVVCMYLSLQAMLNCISLFITYCHIIILLSSLNKVVFTILWKLCVQWIIDINNYIKLIVIHNELIPLCIPMKQWILNIWKNQIQKWERSIKCNIDWSMKPPGYVPETC